ncbi:MAG: NfeD family protein [Clostridiales bacterium]|nr:NfeD family protein [Clostridiales bacterium]
MFGIDAWIIWTILLVAFLIAEAVTFDMVTIWFAIGALAALILDILNAPIWMQITVFVLISTVLLLLFIFMIKPRLGSFMKNSEATNADRVVGEEGIVTLDIDPVQATGLVKVKGQIWSAVSEDNRKIKEGTAVVVTEIRGVRVVVNIKTDDTEEKTETDG